MGQEAGKAVMRRLHDNRFATKYFVGSGIDIGCGNDSLNHYREQFVNITSVREWDRPDGDAMLMNGVPDGTYDFVHSSHCLEHLTDPNVALENWIRIAKSGGHIVIMVPDEDMYEQGQWPSRYAQDHLTSWTIGKVQSWSPVSMSILPLLCNFLDKVEVVKIEKLDAGYKYKNNKEDQTAYPTGECAIEFILKKR